MKKNNSLNILPLLTACAGVAGLLMRMWILRLEDGKGLFPQPHISTTLLFILTAAMMVVIFLFARKTNPDGSFLHRFCPSVWSMLGHLAAALGVVLVCVREFATVGDIFTKVCLPFGLLAACALVFAGIRRFCGRVPAFWSYCAVTVFLMLHAVSQCRSWGAEPQLIVYCFQLLSSIFLMLAAYHRTALVLDKGNYRWFVFVCAAALFFSCVSIAGDMELFYLAMAFWCGCDFCTAQEV